MAQRPHESDDDPARTTRVAEAILTGTGGERFRRIGPLSPELRERELEVAREIAEAFLTAASPVEVYRIALARVAPIVDASFASVFLRGDDDPDLLRLVCAHNWPQSWARFLGDVRIREGRGPTGRAVSRGEPVEVTDVFEDHALEHWWEPARELGFVSMIALPLSVGKRIFGAVSFYFSERRGFDADERALLGVVAHQLAATAERAHLIADLQSSNLRLERQNEALSRRIAEAESALDRVRKGAEGRGLRSPGNGPGTGSR